MLDASEQHLVVMCTCPCGSSTTLAKLIVERKLAACVNIIKELQSIYVWEGQLHCDDEHLLIIKTHQLCYDTLTQTLLQHHPYTVPEIIALPIQAGHPAYLAWLNQQLEITA
jgi:periplasmic divalent cation tolerance protein